MAARSSPARVLVVCTANICRSPVAAALLTSFLDRRRPYWARPVEVTSAGTHAADGEPAASAMVTTAARWSIDLSAHRSRSVTRELATRHDVVITMEAAHRDAVSRSGPTLAGRTFTLTELAELLAHLEAAGTAPRTVGDLVGALQTARPRTAVDAPDVADPYGGRTAGYLQTARELAHLIERIGPALVRACG